MNESRHMADHPLSVIVRRLRGSVNTLDSDQQLLRRFADRRDEAAFAELVLRHGPMVWGVCRRGMPDPNDAEDVFQTTFLVLAKKPMAVVPGYSLGGWLHGVAVRASAQARRGIVRRFAHEAEAARRNAANASTSTKPSDGWLDEELRNLPARYRDPLVLCHIHGLCVAAAADELGCPANTVKTRLARGREMLKKRLIRRGITAPAGVLVAVPAELSASTIQLATGPGAIARPAVLELVSATLNGGLSMRLKLFATAVVLTCGLALTGVAVFGAPLTPKPVENREGARNPPTPVVAETVSSILIVEEGLHRNGVAKTKAISVIEKGPIARVMEKFPNALVSQTGSTPAGWEAEHRVYLFLKSGKVVMLTVGSNGTVWTAPAATGDLKTNGDFVKLLKELSE